MQNILKFAYNDYCDHFRLVLPLVTREVVSLLHPGDTANETADYSNYGFLYGTFPTAPGVFVFASHYNIAVDLVRILVNSLTNYEPPKWWDFEKLSSINNFQ